MLAATGACSGTASRGGSAGADVSVFSGVGGTGELSSNGVGGCDVRPGDGSVVVVGRFGSAGGAGSFSGDGAFAASGAGALDEPPAPGEPFFFFALPDFGGGDSSSADFFAASCKALMRSEMGILLANNKGGGWLRPVVCSRRE